MPHGRVFEFDDPFQLQATLRAGNYEVLPTSKGGFRSVLTRIDFERLWLQRCETSGGSVLRTANHSTRAPMTFLADPTQGPWQQNGAELPHDGISVYRQGALNHHYTRTENRWASMSLTHDDLAMYGEAIAGRELTVPRTTHIAHPGPALMARLRALHGAACNLARSNPDGLAHAPTAKALEQDLICTMVSCLTAGQQVEENRNLANHAKVISRLEDYLAERAHEPVYLAEICKAVGVSARTLRTCCQEHLGMGPTRYLRLRRMHLARHSLLNGDPAKTSVTEIATEYGFWELGRFAVEYRALFGELPSTSLRSAAKFANQRTD
jgi:AraC-like DNA-binding protein